MQVNRDQACLPLGPSDEQRSLGNHPLRIVNAHASRTLREISPGSHEPYSQKGVPSNLTASLLTNINRSVIRIRLDRFG
jgi:hypothetical protein